MLPRERKPSKNFFSNQKIVAIVGTVILILILAPLFKNIKQRREADAEIRGIQDDIQKIEGKNSDLKKMLGYLESNQFLEEQARLNFGLKKNGEEVVVVKNNENSPVQVQDATEPNDVLFNIPGLKDFSEQNNNNFAKWFSYFFKAKNPSQESSS